MKGEGSDMGKNKKKITNLQEFNAAFLKCIEDFRLLDDDFMSKVFEDPKCAEVLLQIILERTDLKVQDVRIQYSLKNLQGRSARLDIFAIDSAGKIYDIEIQRNDKGASEKRARYNSSLLDSNITEPGDEFEDLPETYVIFITENDVLKSNLPIYHIDRTIRENQKSFNDEAHIIYVNSQIINETELGKLMHDFRCKDAKDMYNPILAKRVSYFKEDKEGVAIMCKELENLQNKIREQARAEGLAEGLAEGRATGLAEGRATGHAEGRTEGRLTSILECIQNGSIDDAKRLLKATDEEIAKAEKLLLDAK